MNAKHTKTPWELITDKETGAKYIIGNDGQENILDTVYLSGADCKEADLNARLIVTAVNNHDALVDACIAALRKLREHYTDNQIEEINILKNALKMTESEA